MKYDILEKLRVQRGLTYKALAAEVGMKESALYKIAMGKVNPHARHAYLIERWVDKQKLQTTKGKRKNEATR